MNDVISRLSNGISLTRIITIFWIFSIHYLQLPWFPQFTNGLTYDQAVNSLNLAWVNAATQPWKVDRAFLWASYWGSNGNLCFFIMSGFSLWFSFKVKGFFFLGEYFERRFFNFYLPYAICAIVSYLVIINLVPYSPREYDLYGLLMGGAAFNPHWRYYNSPLWFVSHLLILYLMFPFFIILYKKFKAPGLIALFVLFSWYPGHMNYLYCFTFGILLMEIMGQLIENPFSPKLRNWFPYFATSILLLSVFGIFYFLYLSIPLKLDAPIYTIKNLAICLVVFSLAAGMLFPTNSRFLAVHKFLSRGTLSLYLYHYLFVNVLTGKPWAETFALLTGFLPPMMLNHVSVTFAAIFILLLIVCSLYQGLLDRGIEWIRRV